MLSQLHQETLEPQTQAVLVRAFLDDPLLYNVIH